MASQQVADAFLELLEKSRLLSPEQIAEADERFGLCEKLSALQVAQTLAMHGLITCFQAERLLEGRYRGFFVDRYRVLELLGVGGMSWVYAATDTRTGQKIALKVLFNRFRFEPGMLARFKLEASAGARLSHPNVVRTHEIDYDKDVSYVAMELVVGIGLHEMINLQGPVPWQQACDIVCQTAAALQHAHDADMVHRDVKPSNLLIDHAGRVKLLDFGLALLDRNEDEFSLAMIFGHDCLGTADYIAPEQSLDSYRVDLRADVYSLGCTLYFALTGMVPFPVESNRDKLAAHHQQIATPLRELVPEVPDQLADIVEKMMAKKPEKRFQTATEVIEALARLAHRQPVPFDFRAVLASRATEAKLRIAAQRRHSEQGRHSLSSSTADSTTGSRSTRPLQANIETAICKDTQVEQSTISLADPFDALREVERRVSRPDGGTHDRSGEEIFTALLIPLDGGKSIPLTKDRVVIGRDRDCDVRLSATKVSGKHCELRCERGWWRVIDLNSKNGVLVNGTQKKDQTLWPGDRLTIAREQHFRIKFQSGYSRRMSDFTDIVAFFAGLIVAAAVVGGGVWWLLS